MCGGVGKPAGSRSVRLTSAWPTRTRRAIRRRARSSSIPAGSGETEILIAYGAVRFASKVGELAGNHFLTIVDGVDQLPSLGELTLSQGAQQIEFARL